MLIVFPIIPWGYLRQRPQQLLGHLGGLGLPILYLAPTSEEGSQGEKWWLTRLEPNVFHFWNSIDRSFDVHHEELDEHLVHALHENITAACAALQVQNPSYYVQFPGWMPLVRALRRTTPGPLIYDCMDEHTAFGDVIESLHHRESELVTEARLVLASSQPLLEKALRSNPNSLLLRNGCDFELFRSPGEGQESLELPPRPIAGYFGSLREWFDFDLLRSAAEALPDVSFLIIGDDVLGKFSKGEFPANVHHLERQPHRRLPRYLHAFDVSLIPFRLNALTLATNPVKLYEYLCAGKPIVSVRLPELEELDEVCLLAESPASFVQAIRGALEEEGAEAERRRASRIDLGRRNTWDARARAALGWIEQTLAEITPETAHANRAEHRLGVIVSSLYELELSRQSQALAGQLEEKDRDWQAEVRKIARKHHEEMVLLRDEHERAKMLMKKESTALLRSREQQWSAKLTAAEKHSDRLAADLELIHSSKIWRAADFYWRIRRKLGLLLRRPGDGSR